MCNYVGLHEALGERHPLDLALGLVDQVHHELGRFRSDDRRRGWISGLSEEEGGRHPTAGGLRIGKGRPEREPGEPYDPDAEWDRDGQYYHYLTRWMWALGRVSRVTGDPRYLLWAVELAAAAHRAFVQAGEPGAPPIIHWKMSTDLARPLVASTGQHDALDGFITLSALQAMEARTTPGRGSGVLAREVAELGLSIGLAAVSRMGRKAAASHLGASPTAFEPLRRHLALRGEIEAYWVEPDHRRSATWTDHRDINAVMLATSLAPNGYLDL